MCGEERLLCGKEFTLRVWGRDYCAGVYPGFQRGGGGVPTLYFNRYMSWEGGGLQSVYGFIQDLGGGGGGGCKGGGISLAMGEAAAAPPPPPRPGLTGNRGGGPCNMSLATRQIRARRGFPHLHNKF